ncbi:hypothetical protein WN943_000315 [Citrus x changshan-huyou]
MATTGLGLHEKMLCFAIWMQLKPSTSVYRPKPFFSSLSRQTLTLKPQPFIRILAGMGETRDNEYEDELLDYEEEDAQAPDSVATKANGEAAKKGYVGIHSSGFRDFLLKPELLRAIVDSGFEHPSEG